MPSSPEIREQIIYDLFKGKSVKKIAEKFHKPIGYIQTIRNEVFKDTLDASIESLSKADASVVKALATTLDSQKVSKTVDNVAKGIEALQVLQPKIVKGFDKVVEKLTERLEEEGFELKEIPMIAKTLIEINNSLYNRNQNNTLINVARQQNTLIQTEAENRIKNLTKGILE